MEISSRQVGIGDDADGDRHRKLLELLRRWHVLRCPPRHQPISNSVSVRRLAAPASWSGVAWVAPTSTGIRSRPDLRGRTAKDLVEQPGQDADDDTADQRADDRDLDTDAEARGEVEDQRVDHEREQPERQTAQRERDQLQERPEHGIEEPQDDGEDDDRCLVSIAHLLGKNGRQQHQRQAICDQVDQYPNHPLLFPSLGWTVTQAAKEVNAGSQLAGMQRSYHSRSEYNSASG